MKLILPDLNHKTILVVGDIMLDRYFHGSINKISSEASVPVIKVQNINYIPGGAANVAMNISSIGANVKLFGLLGIDNAANIIKKELKKNYVDYNFIQNIKFKTIIKTRVLSSNKQLIRLDYEQKYKNIDCNNLLLKNIKKIISNINIIVFSDYNKGTLCNIQSMIKLANLSKIPVIIDPKGNNYEKYSGATLLTPNLTEFELVVGKCNSEKELVDKGLNLILRYNINSLLVTRSEHGMSLIQKNKKPIHFKSQAHQVLDVTGAGDTVIGVLSAFLAQDKISLEDSCFLSNIAASIAVNKFGTATVSFDELKNSIKNFDKYQ
ncbi:D-glycero-beta-D-manno-heptose-7-phosphate kinase [Enterobacteriaceae endosymbiont of Plateumaris consimilis]|uniref:D-glycero-beta-D-manno-heptose-7-phosphate kinase n=1 Tax=Enterobacteriaceae endosymbiont of Plateumaris consimilis TaxID=2675794 RepID=UPI001449A975|nr:D-glycero-beta-D-manno-heptose-7-phosphate kinase [Enterobacteriaceae endosymbiont of Plateumaris consimilis]QJC28653.1 D-glycero-beta-D-manno-heptose-7-phosphate kinase [Enterobacteriaceae endosymbiont of Plateumaris consimilis]